MQVHLVDGTYELYRQHFGQATRHSDPPPFAGTIGVLTSTIQLLQDGAIKTQIIACFSRARLSGVNLTPAPLVFTNSPEDGIKLPFIKGVAPGFIETPMTDELTDEQKQKLLGNVPAGRLGSSQEVAAAVSFLASEEAAYMTGATLHVNGGMAML